MAGAYRAVAREATPAASYWLVLSLITLVGMNAVIKIEATGTRLFLVVAVVGVAFSAACFLERLLQDYMRTDTQPNSEPSDFIGGGDFVHVTDALGGHATAAVAPISSPTTTTAGAFGAGIDGDFGYFGGGQLYPAFDGGLLAGEKNTTLRERVGYVTGPSLTYLTGNLPKWLNRGQPVRRAEPQTAAPQTQGGLWCWLPS